MVAVITYRRGATDPVLLINVTPEGLDLALNIDSIRYAVRKRVNLVPNHIG